MLILVLMLSLTSVLSGLCLASESPKPSKPSEDSKCYMSDRAIKRALRDVKVYIQENELDEALKLIDEILCAKPGEVNALYYKGVIAFLKGNCDETLQIMEQVIRRDERFPQAKFYRGLCLISKGEYSRALDDLSRYVNVKLTDPLGYAFKAEALWMLEQREEALKTLRRGIDTTKSNVLRLQLSSYLIQLKRYEEAEKVMLEAERAEMRTYGSLRGDTAVKLAWYSFLMARLDLMRGYLKLAEESRHIDDESRYLLKALKLVSDGKLVDALIKLKGYEGSDPRVFYLRGLLAVKLLSQVRAVGGVVALTNLIVDSFKRACQLDRSNLIYAEACSKLGEARDDAEESQPEERVQAGDSGVPSEGKDTE